MDEEEHIDTSLEESTDEDIDPDNEEFEYDFLRTLGALHSKNPDVLKEDSSYFKDKYTSDKKTKNSEDEPMTIKDYERHIITERGGRYDDEDQYNDASLQASGANAVSIVGHQHGFDDNDESDSDGEDGLLTSGLFKKKEQKSRETDRLLAENDETPAKGSSDALEYLKGNKSTVPEKKDEPLLSALKTAWTDPKLSDKDKWLVDYFVNRRFKDQESENVKRAYNHTIIDEETISEDEATLTKMEEFETKYRFRFEEPDQEFIKSYPRVINDSVRVKKNKRKEKRDNDRLRKEDEKMQKQKEIDEIKAQKRKQVNDKINKIKSISGNDCLTLMDKDIDDDFDPDAHDAVMSKWFGEDYYDGDDDGGEQYPSLNPEESSILQDIESSSLDNPDNEVLPEEEEDEEKSSKRSKNLKKKKVFKGELHKYDFEDLIGGTTFRFKYNNVAPNNFGLTTTQILQTSDKELNQWCSIKKITKFYRTDEEEKRDLNQYTKKSLDEEMHKKFNGIFNMNEENSAADSAEKKRLKNLKKKMRKQEKAKLLAENNSVLLTESTTQETTSETKKQKKKVKKEIPWSTVDIDSNNLTDETFDENTEVSEQDTSSPCKKAKTSKKSEKVQNSSETDFIEDKICTKKRKVETIVENVPKSKKNKKMNSLTENISNEFEDSSILPNEEVDDIDENLLKIKKKKKKSKKNKQEEESSNTNELHGICDDRLEAYGQNPKKIKNKLKYKNC